MDAQQGKKKFSIIVEATATVSRMIEVDSTDSESAQKIAFEVAKRSKYYEWQIDKIDPTRIHTRRINGIS